MSQFTDAFMGEIRMFAGSFAPEGWALCQGQVLPIVEYQALFSILGSNYGGDGRSTFALPDLRGRVPVQQGTGPGLTPVALSQQFGYEGVKLTTLNLPAHTHNTLCSSGSGTKDSPVGNYAADEGHGGFKLYSEQGDAMMGKTSVAGNADPEAIRLSQPSLGINFIIAIEGTYPPRS